MPVPSTAIKPLEEAVGHAVDAANLQEEQLSPDAVVSFVGQHLMRFGTMAASEEPALVRKLCADVSQASADDVLDALSRGERQIVQLRQRMQSALKEVARPWLAELAKFLGSDMAAEVAPARDVWTRRWRAPRRTWRRRGRRRLRRGSGGAAGGSGEGSPRDSP